MTLDDLKIDWMYEHYTFRNPVLLKEIIKISDITIGKFWLRDPFAGYHGFYQILDEDNLNKLLLSELCAFSDYKAANYENQPYFSQETLFQK